ncbi:MAG: flavodoxin family protein [Rhodobacteraceae bacterium]|nr:flavodoxin family protein [Paracoccaceae bacterium]
MTDNVKKIAVVYHSGYGHTKVQAESVAEGVNSVEGVAADLVSVEDVTDDLERLAEADGIVFGSPTYMGSVSAQFKAFMDASSGKWAEQGWANKIAGGFTNSAAQNGDKLNTLIQMSIFAAQHGMVWVGLGMLPGNNTNDGSEEDLNRMGATLGAMAQSNADAGPDVAPPPSDRETARLYGARIALAAKRWAA